MKDRDNGQSFAEDYSILVKSFKSWWIEMMPLVVKRSIFARDFQH